MFTKAELLCGVSGFLIVSGMVTLTSLSITLTSLSMLCAGLCGIIISTIYESN